MTRIRRFYADLHWLLKIRLIRVIRVPYFCALATPCLRTFDETRSDLSPSPPGVLAVVFCCFPTVVCAVVSCGVVASRPGQGLAFLLAWLAA